jgi:hypothetical protein
MLYGTTYSHRHAASLKLNPVSAFVALLSLKLDVIRLGCYWDDLEPEENHYDFSSIRTYLDLCEEAKQTVILTVGMKAPRWPEFFIPIWLRQQSFETVIPLSKRFIQKAVSELRDYPCIKYWQVENEPLDPSGPFNRAIPLPVLTEEVALVRALDASRPVIVNLWGNDLSNRNLTRHAAKIADIIGLDMYYKQFLTKKLAHSFYGHPRDSEDAIKRHLEDFGKPLWITELQAEPWEANHMAYLSDNPKSCNPSLLQKNIERAKIMQPEAILLWGSEYWLWKKGQGDSQMWDAVRNLLP